MKSWLVAHHMTLMAIADTPHSIALRVGDRNFLRFHAAVSAEDVALDRCGVDFSLQQDRSRDCGHAARCRDLGDAGDLCRRIPVRLLDTESASGAAGTFSPVSIARLRALACVFTGHLAHLLAGIYWFALRRRSFRNIYLFSHAVADQPRQNSAEDSMKVERVVLNEVSMESARPRAVRCEAARGRADSTLLGSNAFFSTR